MGRSEDDCEDSEDEDGEDYYTGRHVPFEEGHKEYHSHVQLVLADHQRLIPMPWGEALPRRDRPALYERYCHLMLIFFKPWKHGSDLRVCGKSWADTLSEFCLVHPEWVPWMNNMQLLHECRDSRDDHFEERRWRVGTMNESAHSRQ